LITGSSNSGWTGLGKAELYRKWYMEIELKPGENTNLGNEVGFNKKGLKSTSDGYATPASELRGRVGYDVAMFNSKGKILGTDVAYTPNKWYKFCQLIDCDAKVNVWNVYTNNDSNPDYETLVLSISDTLPTSLTSGYEDTVCVYSKYKLLLQPNDFTSTTETEQMATAYIDNYTCYMPIAQPVVETVAANGVTIVNDVIAKGTDAVTVTLDKAYYALTAADIAVTVDGEAVGTVTVVDNKTFTISGLSTVAEGKKINVKLADTLDVIYNYAAGSAVASVTADVKGAYEFNIYVGDANKVCLYPLSVETETGAELLAYSKFINGSGSALNTYLIMTEYANDAKTLVAQTNFAPVTIKAGKVGAVSGYLTGITKAEGCQVMLWNTDFAPILEAGALAQ